MDLIVESINPELKNLIIRAYNNVESKLKIQNQKIQNLNIYHYQWDDNSKLILTILDALNNHYNISSNKIISLAFINIQPNCNELHFHTDYKTFRSVYLIPLNELDTDNGIDYLEFKSSVKNISLVKQLKKIGDRFTTKDGIIGYLNSINVKQDEYSFKSLKTKPYSLFYMPNYLLYRITKNKDNYNKTILQIIFDDLPSGIKNYKIIKEDSDTFEEDLD